MTLPLVRLAVRPLWEWPLRCAFLAAASGLLMGVVANALLWQLGLPYLFWHESAGRRLFAGIGVGMFTVNVAVVGFLLASRRPWITELRAFWPEWGIEDYVVGLLARYLLLTSAVLVALVWVFALRAPYYLGWPGRVGFAASVTAGAAGAAFFLWRTRRFAESHARRGTWLGRLLTRLDRRPRVRSFLPVAAVHRAAAVFFLGQLVFFVGCGLLAATPVGRLMSAGLVLAMFMTVAVSVYGAIRWWAEDERLVWFAALAVLWVGLAAVFPYRHTLYDLRAEYRHPVPVTVRPPSNPALLTGEATLAAWAAGAGSRPLVVVAVDGGGIRAATWTVSMLATLEKDLPRFAAQVRLITGASGGMVGAAYWVATLQPPGAPAAHATHAGRGLSGDAMIDAISKDSLEATARRLVFRDISPVVWQAYADRGYAMEHQWEENTEAMDQTLAQLAPGEAAGWRPSLAFSPMIVEDGRRLLVSNLDLGALVAADVPAAAAAGPESLSALELAKMVPAARNLHVSTVARMSASFPYVSPAVEVPTRPLRRVVDAAYYDEHGVALAADWILANEAALRRYASKVALVQIPDQSTTANRLPDPCARSWWSRGLSDFLSPPEGILSGWSGAMSFRNDEMLQAVGRILNAGGQDYFRTFVFEPYDQVPPPDPLYADTPGWDACAREYCARAAELRPVALSWHMISGHREFLRGASPNTEANCRVRRELVQWWTGAPAPLPSGCRNPAPAPSPLCVAGTLSVQ